MLFDASGNVESGSDLSAYNKGQGLYHINLLLEELQNRPYKSVDIFGSVGNEMTFNEASATGFSYSYLEIAHSIGLSSIAPMSQMAQDGLGFTGKYEYDKQGWVKISMRHVSRGSDYTINTFQNTTKMPFFLQTSDTHGYLYHAEVINSRFIYTHFTYLVTPPIPTAGSNSYATPGTPLNISGYSMNIPVFIDIDDAAEYFTNGITRGITRGIMNLVESTPGTGNNTDDVTWIFRDDLVRGSITNRDVPNYYKFRVHTTGDVAIRLEPLASNITFSVVGNRARHHPMILYSGHHLLIRELIPGDYTIEVTGGVGAYRLQVMGSGVCGISAGWYEDWNGSKLTDKTIYKTIDHDINIYKGLPWAPDNQTYIYNMRKAKDDLWENLFSKAGVEKGYTSQTVISNTLNITSTTDKDGIKCLGIATSPVMLNKNYFETMAGRKNVIIEQESRRRIKMCLIIVKKGDDVTDKSKWLYVPATNVDSKDMLGMAELTRLTWK